MSYGLPSGAAVNYGALGFPNWVDDLCREWGIDSSTYPGHQTGDRKDIGAAPNPQRLNRGIDWAGPPDTLLRFARWLVSTAPPRTAGQYGPEGLEMLIYQHPSTGERVWYPTWVNYSSDFGGHRDHVHTRFSAPPIVEAKPKLTRQDQYALAIIREGQRRGVTPRGIQIALATVLVESNLKMYANASVPESLNLPHDAVGFDHDSVGLFQQRCPMWGPVDMLMDPTKSAGLFYDHLQRLDYNGPNSPGSYAQAVQRSAYPDRYDQRFNNAVTLYNRLAGPAPLEEDFLSALSADEQRALYNEIMGARASRSPLRHVGEGNVFGGLDDPLLNSDGSIHTMLIYLLAVILGDPDAIALLREVAAINPARDPDRVHDSRIAQAMLNLIDGKVSVQSAPPTGQTPGVIPTPVIPAPVPQPVPAPAPVAPLPAPQPALPAVNGSTPDTGEVIAQLYRALDDLRLADAMPIEARAPMSALVQILQTKNGTPV